MTAYRIEVESEGREVYTIEAGTPEEAKRIFNAGKAGQPDVLEMISVSVVSVEKVTDRHLRPPGRHTV